MVAGPGHAPGKGRVWLAWRMAAVVALAVGCAARGGRVQPPVDMTAVPASRPADCYGGAIEARPPLDPWGGASRRSSNRWASGKGLAALTEDERLDRVASDMACAMSGGKSPAPELLTFLASYYGLVEPEPSVVLISGEAGAEAAIIDQLGRKLADAPASAALGSRSGSGFVARARLFRP